MSGASLTTNPFIERAQKRNPFIEKAREYDRKLIDLKRGEPFPDSPEEMLKVLSQLSDDQLKEMLEAHGELERRLKEFGPQNDDELHAWIKDELSLDIPRTSVCESHDPPFKFLSDLYFERVNAALAMANRGGAKTLIVAILHWINSLFKPGCESCTFGATEAQSLRCYAHLKNWIYDKRGEKRPEVVSSLMRETIFSTGSTVEVLPGCLPPHAQVITPEGNMRIGEIVSKRLVGPVKTFNFETDQFEWQEITDWHVNGKGTDWLKFALEISTLQGPSDLYCTHGHRLLKPDGTKAHAIEFIVGDELCVQALVLDEEQEQVAIGMLLGDANISSGAGHRYRVCHSSAQIGYLEWFADAFSEFTPYWSRREAKNTFDVDLKCSRKFTELYREWYVDGTKRIPDHVWQNLSPLGLACWLMDDGSWTQSGSGKQQRGGIWTICAMNFNKHERECVDKYFSDMGIDGGWRIINADKDQWVWRTTGEGGVVLQSLVSDYIDISEKQPKGYKRWIAQSLVYRSEEKTVPAKIKSITSTDIEQTRYDITVPPHANYVVSSGLVISNTPQAVNGPHPQKAHADEIEQMDDGTWKESRNMTISKTLPDGRVIIPQDIGTSTRKGPNGRMQLLIDEITDAINHGYKPPRTLYQWCIKETAAQVKNCQVANPDLPEEKHCPCHLIRKGEWSERDNDGRPRPRLLSDICAGDFHKSRGWQPLGDVIKQFTENDQETFEVQQLCLRPEMKHHYLPKFSEERHCIRNFDANPANGPMFTSTDWGGTNPHAVNWYQYLQFELEVDVWLQPNQKPKRIRVRQGSVICFDEVYRAEIGNTRLGQLVKLKEAGYRRRWGPSWQVKERFADPQGKAARLDWKKMGMKTSWHITREFEEHIKVSNDFFDDDLFFVDGEKCPMWVREAKEWRRNPNTGQQIDKYNHAMSNYRYAIANIRKLYPITRIEESHELPGVESISRESVVSVTIRKPDQGPLGFASPQENEFARWRHGLGQPVRNAP